MLVFRYFYSYEDISCYVQLICISRYELKALYENLYYLNLNTKIIVYAESVTEKPMFREAYQKRRCLAPASGFYEWRKNGRGKIPYYFSPKNEREPLVFAGLWENWNNGNETLWSFTIITTAANDFMKPIHDRMPLILKPEFWRKWIAPEAGLSEIDKILEQPAGNDVLQNWEVSPYVNNAAHEGACCIARINFL